MAATTTIKVTTHARDRINAEARALGVTPAVLLERLLDDYQRSQRFDAIRARYAELSNDRDYEAETTEWAVTDADGLDRD
ncbi:toxin-antitoxin system protein [Yimella sp. cx-51]|uniref:toxin-antitoxin system protein n=1 Tax=Yimella sp. cx-51 TaxID=2770551 RepID=UPI00165EB483|nr:toxin-antitoxin system protein [Yimella sp. cx-51]MBC9957319.1 toxin-antitoxin system protein [Yimella sp. cx-51]QTH36816.1 hypothetical protein J5M86_07555 [Yimella sp. cx-51]